MIRRLIRSTYILCGHCEKSGSYSVPDRGIGARIAPGLISEGMGLQPAKQSAAIFSGIPVLRGDFGEGGGGCGKIGRSLIYFNIFNGFECDTLVMVVPETIIKLIERFDFHRQSHISSRDVYKKENV